MAECLLCTGLPQVRYEEKSVGMSKNILLGQPGGQQEVVRLVLHGLSLPLPDHSLLQLSKH